MNQVLNILAMEIGEGKLRIDLTIYTNNENIIGTNMVITPDGVIEIETDEEIEGEEE